MLLEKYEDNAQSVLHQHICKGMPLCGWDLLGNHIHHQLVWHIHLSFIYIHLSVVWHTIINASRSGVTPILVWDGGDPYHALLWSITRHPPCRRLTSIPHHSTFGKYCSTAPIYVMILLQEYGLLLGWCTVYTNPSVKHTSPPICFAMLLQKYWGKGSLGHSHM